MVGMARRRGAAMPAGGGTGEWWGSRVRGRGKCERGARRAPPRDATPSEAPLGHIREGPPSAQIRASFPRKSELPGISTIIPTALTPPFQRTHACPRSRTPLGSPPNHPPHPTHAPPGPRGPPRGLGQKITSLPRESKCSGISTTIRTAFARPFQRTHSRARAIISRHTCPATPTGRGPFNREGSLFHSSIHPATHPDPCHAFARAAPPPTHTLDATHLDADMLGGRVRLQQGPHDFREAVA